MNRYAEQVAECEDIEVLRAMWKIAGPERQEQIKARVDELNTVEEALPIEEQG